MRNYLLPREEPARSVSAARLERPLPHSLHYLVLEENEARICGKREKSKGSKMQCAVEKFLVFAFCLSKPFRRQCE